MIKVIITDDHKVVLNGIESMLQNATNIEVSNTFKDANSTLKALQQVLPDVLLLDINLPDKNGIELAKEISQKFPSVSIIALTNFEDISFVRQMLSVGAKGYLLKNTDKDELIEAIEAVFNGEEYLQKDIQKKIIDFSLGKKKSNKLSPKLTQREGEVLIAISEELTTQEISEKLFISPKTVETHRMNLMSKLGAKNTAGIIKTAFRLGLLS